MVSAAGTIGFSLIHVVSGVLYVVGLIRLATPEPESLPGPMPAAGGPL
jgi:hypothetical protein